MKKSRPGILTLVCLLAAVAHAEGVADLEWDPGADECTSPDQKHLEVRYLDSTTIALRQNPCIDYEANILYLLVGKTRSMLIDTGAVDEPQIANLTVTAVEEILRTSGAQHSLLVVHTHRHQDHRAGDAQFASMQGARIAPIESEPLRKFFGFTHWPNDLAQIDLGDRVVDLIPTPGHQQDHIVFYDRNTRLLFTGDFLLPGRLLVQDLDAYRASAQRVVEFVKAHPVDHVLGAHIELAADGSAYAFGSTFHPHEHALALTAQDVLALPAALADFNGFYSRYPNFIVENSVHNLMALATIVVVALALLVWVLRRWWKRRRAVVA